MQNIIDYMLPSRTFTLSSTFLFITAAVIAYFIGSIPNGYIIGKKAYGKDLTKLGSGNIGATNVQRVLGMKPALIVFILDFLEGFVTVTISKMLFKSTGFALYTGFFAALGHDYSIFMPHFRGGKGVATSFGVIMAISPLSGIIGVAIFVIVVFASKFVSLGSLIGSISVPFVSYLLSKNYRITLFLLPFAILIFISHRENIRRLLSGKERKIGEKIIPK